MTLRKRITQGLANLTGTGAGASLVLALLVVASVFVAVVTPRASLEFRTKALRQLIAQTPPAGRSISGSMDMPTLGAALGPPGEPTFDSINYRELGSIGNELARHIRATGLPIAGKGWWGASTGYLPAPGSAKSAHDGSTAPIVELLDRSALGSYAKVISGRLPGTSSVSNARARFDVVVTPATAARFSLRVGSVVTLADHNSGSVPTVRLTVTGIIRPLDPASSFWTADPDALHPTVNKGPVWLGAMFISNGEVEHLENAIDYENIRVTWEFPIDLRRVTANGAQSISYDIGSALANAGTVTQSVDNPTTIPLSTALTGALIQFVLTQTDLGSLLSLLYVSLTIVGLVVLLLGARLLAERRATELGLIRARGAARWQLAAYAAAAGAVIVLPAAAVGVALGVALTPGQNESLAWWLAAVTVVVAVGSVPWLALRQVWGTGLVDERADSSPGRQVRIRRIVADVGTVLAAIAGLIVLRQQGQPAAGGTDWYTSAAPVLVAVPVAVIAVRVYPFVLRWLVGLTGRRQGVTTFVGLARATRASLSAVLPAFALVLALAVIAFGAMLRAAVVSGDIAQSWHAVGADVVIDAYGSNNPVTPSVERDISGVPGVRWSTAITVTTGAAQDGSTLGVIVVNPASYAALLARTPAAAFDAQALAQSPGNRAAGGLPALATPAAVSAIGGKKLLIGISDLAINVRGTTSSLPGVTTTGPFIVVPTWAVDGAIKSGRTTPNLILLVGPVDQARLASVIAKQLPGNTTTTYRSAALSALTDATLPRGAYATFAQAALAAAAFGAIIMLIMLALGARPRELTLARLFTMGLSQRQARRLVITEALPVILAATVGGAVSAWALVPLIGPSIDLSLFTGSSTPVPLHPDFAVIGYLAAGLVVIALVTLFAQAAATRLRGVSRALRVGE